MKIDALQQLCIAFADSLKEAMDYFVTGPVNYVFRRPLGDF